jgi:hypothetical protein
MFPSAARRIAVDGGGMGQAMRSPRSPAFSDFCNKIDKADRHRAEDRRLFYHPCFATRLGGVLGGKETQG